MTLTLILICSACVKGLLKGQEFKALNISSCHTETKLLQNFKKKYKLAKLNSSTDNVCNEKAFKSLLNGNLDVYIGSLDIPIGYYGQIENQLIAKDGLVIVSHPSNPINNLSSSELQNIFSRKTQSWKDLHGTSKPIVVIDREESNSERKTLYKELFGSSAVPLIDAITVSSIDEVKAAINQYPNSISYINFSNLSNNLKAFHIDNIPASSQNISSGYFPLSRPISIYYNPKKLKELKKKRSFKKFLSFVYDKGQGIISEHKYMPLTEAELQLIEVEADPIYIGVAAPMEGPYIDLGKSIINAAKLAVEEINDGDGIDGKPIELIVCNDRATVSNAIECANKFVKSNVVGVVGHLTSQASIEASKIYTKHNIVQITPASTHPWFTERPGAKGYAFRTIGRDDKQAKLITSLIEDLKLEHPIKVSIFNNGTIYGSTLSTLIENEILKRGQDKITEIKSLTQDQNQYHKEIGALESDVLVFVGEYGDAAQLVKGLALNNKDHITFIGADGTFSQRFIDEAGLRAEGAYVTGSSMDLSSAEVQEFNNRFKSRFKMQASAFAMNSYDATNILLNAISIAHKKGSDLNHEIQSAHHQGITGTINFNSIGDPVSPRMSIYRVVKGQFVKQGPLTIYNKTSTYVKKKVAKING